MPRTQQTSKHLKTMKKPNILWYLATFTTLQQLSAGAYGFQPTTCKLGIGDSNGSQSTDSYFETPWSSTIEQMWFAWRAIACVAALILQ